jgi:hypothetical protein
MKRILKWGLGVLALLFVGIQLVPVERANPSSDPSRAIWAGTQVTPEVAGLLRNSCGDCHSNDTRWPWYSHLAPVSWFVTEHVKDGRRHLNFSEWLQDAGGPRRAAPEKRLEEICDEVSKGGMPLRSYSLIHRNASLSADDVRRICEWTAAERKRLAMRSSPQ